MQKSKKSRTAMGKNIYMSGNRETLKIRFGTTVFLILFLLTRSYFYIIGKSTKLKHIGLQY